ncbi:hypothetical protein GQ600_1677 [Phytophthora cactorum]|nr:hypothetical protein GQ600_1677 [Phytophthora cactorum]
MPGPHNTVNTITGAVEAAFASAGITQLMQSIQTIHNESRLIAQALEINGTQTLAEMQTNAETSQQISSSVLNASSRNTVHEIESPNTVEELRRESPRRQLEIPKVMEVWFAEYQCTTLSITGAHRSTDYQSTEKIVQFPLCYDKIENIARRQETYVDNPSLSQARQMLSASMSELPIHDLTTPDVANIYSGQPSFTSYENKVDYRG